MGHGNGESGRGGVVILDFVWLPL